MSNLPPKPDSRLARINRLPPKILSVIFILCQRIWQICTNQLESHIGRSYECQLALSAVCRSWREIALDTTTLWTYIKLTRPTSSPLSELFLSRSGNVEPLNIDLRMIGSFWQTGGHLHAGNSAVQILNFLTPLGAPPSRWNSLHLEADIIETLYSSYLLFQQASFPSLRSSRLIYSGSSEPATDLGREIQETVRKAPLKFGETPTQLRDLKLHGLLIPYLLGESTHSQLRTLEYLELKFAGGFLELLDCDHLPAAILLSGHNVNFSDMAALGQPRVLYPSLKSLSILNVSCAVWVLNHLLTLDAPQVTRFELTIALAHWYRMDNNISQEQLISYIATSNLLHATTVPKPLFPSLLHLTYSNAIIFASERDLKTLLSAYPQLISLSIPDCTTLTPLFWRPWLVPWLEQLQVGVKDAKQLRKLKSLLIARREAGIPLRIVHVNHAALGDPITPAALQELEQLAEISLTDTPDLKFAGLTDIWGQ
ncbi:unnamed protein product [Rhizoctonia solani]|uniref:F-box domain-containing protein n=1 Tax=Rhizoctonia solani TaxID=456999 RepID=A0A8H3HHT0_9AGAM|nr:unnamed protein product [Rhizoctonia solani]CAE6532934.1 unnamed protein product [Rhizoctonia solani]